jgi:lysophospholipase L1-like esterase
VKRLAAALLGIVAGLLLCEATTRLLASRLFDLSHPSVRFDPEVGWVQETGITAVRHNEAGQEVVIAGSALGIRQPPTPYRFGQPDEVLLVGDSFTAGTQVPYAETWGAQLHQRLARRHPSLEIVNAGVDRYDLAQEYRLADRLWGMVRPRVLVVGVFLGNDIADYDHEAGARPPWQPGGVGVWLREHSYLARYVEGALARTRRHEKKPPAEPNRVDAWAPRSVPGFASLRFDEQQRIRNQFTAADVMPVLRGGAEAERRLETTARVLAAMASLAREHGAGFVIVLLPMKQEILPAQRAEWMELQGLSKDDVERPRRRLIEIAEREGWTVVDPAPVLRAQPSTTDLYWKVDLHMTPLGHAAVAEALAPAVDEALARASRP